MADVLADILTAFNQARFEVADDFDRMRSDNMKFYRSHVQSWVDGVYQEYGDDGWGQFATYGAALLSSTGDVLLDFVQGVGSSTFLDPLRLGAGVKKGTVGGYVEDSLRVVGVVGGAVNSPPPEGGGFGLRLEAGSFSLKAEGRKTRVRQ